MAVLPNLLIDASIYIFHYYFALPDHWFSEEQQWPTAAVYGYTAFLIRLLKNQGFNRIAICFDESLGTCFRNDIYPAYKASRALPDDALAFQLQSCRRVSELLGIACFSSERYEADDLIGSLYCRLLRSQQPIAILSRDKDLGQLLHRQQDFLWDYLGDQKFYAADIEKKFGVMPEQLADYLALVGDNVDDIPGVPGIGKKTAQKLLAAQGSIDQLLANSQAVADLSIRGARSIADKLQAYQEQLLMARRLTGIVTNIPLVDSVKALSWGTPDWLALEAFCVEMGFPKLSKTLQILK